MIKNKNSKLLILTVEIAHKKFSQKAAIHSDKELSQDFVYFLFLGFVLFLLSVKFS
jgi:hypothetical protein